VRPVDRLTPARNAETVRVVSRARGFSLRLMHTQHCIKCVMSEATELLRPVNEVPSQLEQVSYHHGGRVVKLSRSFKGRTVKELSD